MPTIYYYTGTGNSLWVARALGEEIGGEHGEETSLVSMTQLRHGPVQASSICVGLVFPVHVWGVPTAVLDFLSRLEVDPSAYLFAVAVNAGQVSRTLIQLQSICAAKGLELKSGCSLAMPSNYIPWGGPGTEARKQLLYRQAVERLKAFASLVRERKAHPVDRGPLWQRLVFSTIYKLTLGQIPRMDKNFWVDDKCNGCGLCVQVCPASNIAMEQGKPTWSHHCQQCLSCIQWCPKQAMQYGSKTPRYPRYHHPEVSVTDIVQGRRLEQGLPESDSCLGAPSGR